MSNSKSKFIIHLMKINWKEILKLLITILTAIAGTLGVVSCL